MNSAYLLRCARARVAVHGTDHVLQPLIDACRPWFTATELPSRVFTRHWTVHLDETMQPYGDPVPCRVGISVHLDAKHRTLVVAPPDPTTGNRPHIRLLRALMRRQLGANSEVFLPAAIVSISGRGLALAGPTCTGKTSTALTLLHRHRGRAQFVANDDSSLSLHGNHILARGYPRAIGVRHATLPHLGPAAHALAAVTQLDGPGDALYLHPRAAAYALGAGTAASVPLAALVLLSHAIGKGSAPTLTRLSPVEATETLAPLVEDADAYETWLDPHLPTARPHRARVARFVRTLPIWRLTQPLHALPRSADLLAQLATAPGGTR